MGHFCPLTPLEETMDAEKEIEQIKELMGKESHSSKLLAVSRNFNPTTGYVFLTIYSYYEHFGEALPGDEYVLCDALEINYRTLRRSIRSLKDANLIEVSRAKGFRRLKPNFNASLDETFWKSLGRTWRIIRGEEIVTNTAEFDPIAIQAIEYWNSKEGIFPVAIPLNHGGTRYETTPQFSALVKKLCVLMTGKLFNGLPTMRFWHDKTWNLDEIKQSIDNFHLAATSTEYLPYDKSGRKKYKMLDFIYCPFNQYSKSLLVEYQEPPKPASVKPEQIQSQPLFLSLQQEYSSVYPGYLNPIKTMKLAVGSNRLNEWVSKHKKYLPTMPQANIWASYVLESIIELIQKRGQWTYDPLETISKEWFWDYFTQFMQKKGLLSTYSIK
jgi:hypothetical protein